MTLLPCTSQCPFKVSLTLSFLSICLNATGFGVNISEVAQTITRKCPPEKNIARELVAFDEVSFKEALKYVEATEGAVLSHISGETENLEYAEKTGVKALVVFENHKKKTVTL